MPVSYSSNRIFDWAFCYWYGYTGIECSSRTFVLLQAYYIIEEGSMSDEVSNQGPARILIVEDEAIVAEDLALSLPDLGYQVVGTVMRCGFSEIQGITHGVTRI